MEARARPWGLGEAAGAVASGWQGEVVRTRYQPLVAVVIAVTVGIVADRYLTQSVGFFGLLTLATGCLVAWWVPWQRHRDEWAACCLLVSVAATGAAWHHARWSLFDRHEIARFASLESAPACVEAIAIDIPERVPAARATPLRAIPGTERSTLVVDVRSIRDGTRWLSAAGRCELSVNGHLLGVRPGDRLRIFGQLARPTPPMNPGEFDFASHARTSRELSRMRSSAPECVGVVQAAQGLSPHALLERVRQGGQQMVYEYIGPERAGIASAILLGVREALPSEETESFLVTGTIHVIVVSGLHVVILVLLLYWIMQLGLMRRRKILATIAAVAVLYAIITGGQPPVMRAAVITVLMCYAAWTGQRAVAFNSLAGAALVVLALNPAELFSVGTQLSFLAVSTLIWLHEIWPRQRVDRLEALVEAAKPWPERAARTAWRWAFVLTATTGVVWLASLPLVLFQFHLVTPVAMLLSIPMWFLSFAILWSGFLLLTVGWLAPLFAGILGWVCDWSLVGLTETVRWAEALPGGHFWAPGPAWWWVSVFYIGLLAVMLRGRRVPPVRWQCAALAAWVIVGLVPPLTRHIARDSLDYTFIAVGHGAAVLLQSPTGETLLYDAGALGSPEYATQSVAAALWHRGIMHIDAIVISHADIDHYNAVPGLLERFSVGAIYVSPMMFDGFEDGAIGGPPVLRQAIQRAGVPIREIWSGDKLRIGPEVTAAVFHPPRQGVIGSDNANSIVLAVEYGEQRLLLPGDLETPGIEAVTAELPYDCDLLMAPHHGSRRSDPPGFAAWSTPEWVVISGGDGEEIKPVIKTYEASGARVLATSECGECVFSLTPSTLRVATFRPVSPD